MSSYGWYGKILQGYHNYQPVQCTVRIGLKKLPKLTDLLHTLTWFPSIQKRASLCFFSFPLDLLVSFSEVTPYSFFCVNSSLFIKKLCLMMHTTLHTELFTTQWYMKSKKISKTAIFFDPGPRNFGT